MKFRQFIKKYDKHLHVLLGLLAYFTVFAINSRFDYGQYYYLEPYACLFGSFLAGTAKEVWDISTGGYGTWADFLYTVFAGFVPFVIHLGILL